MTGDFTPSRRDFENHPGLNPTWTRDEWIARETQNGHLESLVHELGRTLYLRTPHGNMNTIGRLRPALYRYTKRSYIDELIKSGRYYFNPLYGYITGSNLNAAQHDLGEGMISATTRDQHGFFHVINLSSLDCWTSCFSTELSASLAARFEVDGVFEVTDYEFFREMARGIALHAWVGRLYEVEYVDGGRMIDDNLGSYESASHGQYFARRLKNARFAWQKEYRICFEPRQTRFTRFFKNCERDSYDDDLETPGNHDYRRDIVEDKASLRYAKDGEDGLIEPLSIYRPRLAEFIRRIDLATLE